MRRLLIDIETSPLIGYAWGTWNVNISNAQLIKPPRVLSYAAKFVGEKKLYFASEFHNTRDEMVSSAHELMTAADAIITYNGPAFDIPHLNTEFALRGLAPPAPSKQIDLLLTVKRQFKFPSNKLEYVAPALGIGEKVKHPGFEMWDGCLQGDPKSWAQMKKYNIGDVDPLLEDLYLFLLPWIQSHPNAGLYEGDGCTRCGSSSYQKRGFSYTSMGSYQRYQCNDCYGWFSDSKRVMGTDMKGTS